MTWGGVNPGTNLNISSWKEASKTTKLLELSAFQPNESNGTKFANVLLSVQGQFHEELTRRKWLFFRIWTKLKLLWHTSNTIVGWPSQLNGRQNKSKIALVS